MQKLITTAALLASAVYALPTDLTKRDDFPYAAIGDSWSSGVTYWTSNEYDNNANECMRVNHAYSAQLAKDFPVQNVNPKFTFASCSGSRLTDMVKQMDNVGDNNKFVVMQAGGNDAGFFKVASDCVYHQDTGKDYQGPYGGAGPCMDTINGIRNFAAPGAGFYQQVKNAITDVMNHPKAKEDKNFQLYVMGYAALFNSDPGNDWCDSHTFGVDYYSFTGKPQPLNHDVRWAIDDLVDHVNDRLADAAKDAGAGFGGRVTFINPSSEFEGHRFCEPGHNINQQYNTDAEVWLWNLTPWLSISPTIFNIAAQQNAINQWQTAYNNTDHAAAQNALKNYNTADLLVLDKGDKIQPWSQGGNPGVLMRPFHPTERGHTAIKDALKKALSQDFAVPITGKCTMDVKGSGNGSCSYMMPGVSITSTSQCDVACPSEGSPCTFTQGVGAKCGK